MTTRVIIVRHGQSNYNLQQMIQGRCDESVITEQGRTQAQQVGTALSSYKIDAFYHSPLKRAVQTAEIIHSYLQNPPTRQVAEKLMEIDLPLWEKMRKQEVMEKFAEDYLCWKQRPHEFKMVLSSPEGTKEHFPIVALYQQAQEFWQELLSQHQGETVLIVAHNGINRCLISSAIGVPSANYHRIQQSNGGISVLNFTGNWGEAVQLESLNQTAHTGNPLPSYRKPHQGARLLLVRHGETQWNRESRFQGQIDVPLNEQGKKQGQGAADFLQNVKLDFAVSSPMARPKETAEIIVQNRPEVSLELKDEFREISHGLWEGKLEAEIDKEYRDLLCQWKESPEIVQMPEGENLQQVWDRGVAGWNNLVKAVSNSTKPPTGIVVAHDAINKVILCYLLGLTPANFWNIKQGNGAVSVIDYPEGAEGHPVLQAINITSHLGAGILDKTAAGAL